MDRSSRMTGAKEGRRVVVWGWDGEGVVGALRVTLGEVVRVREEKEGWGVMAREGGRQVGTQYFKLFGFFGYICWFQRRKHFCIGKPADCA